MNDFVGPVCCPDRVATESRPLQAIADLRHKLVENTHPWLCCTTKRFAVQAFGVVMYKCDGQWFFYCVLDWDRLLGVSVHELGIEGFVQYSAKNSVQQNIITTFQISNKVNNITRNCRQYFKFVIYNSRAAELLYAFYLISTKYGNIL